MAPLNDVTWYKAGEDLPRYAEGEAVREHMQAIKGAS